VGWAAERVKGVTRAGIDVKDYSGHSLRAAVVMVGVSERIDQRVWAELFIRYSRFGAGFSGLRRILDIFQATLNTSYDCSERKMLCPMINLFPNK
jgi:hypothetical protein